MTGRSFDDWVMASELPRLEARMLLEHASGRPREWLIAHGAEPAPPAIADRFTALLGQRMAGQPMAHLLGYREFYGRRFKVDAGVLIPRPETELLLEAALARAPASARVLDIGTGSGNLAISLACERSDLTLVATDRSAQALAVARLNGSLLAAPADQLGRLQWRLGEGWTPIAPHERFDLIVSNPPYVAIDDPHLVQGDVRFEPRQALTDEHDGLTLLRLLVNGAIRHLSQGGWLMVEHGHDQEAAVSGLMQGQGYLEIATLRDLAGQPRVTIGRRPPVGTPA